MSHIMVTSELLVSRLTVTSWVTLRAKLRQGLRVRVRHGLSRLGVRCPHRVPW